MKERESLYLRALLALVREDVEHNRDLTTAGFDEYETTGACPTAVNGRKTYTSGSSSRSWWS